MFNLDRLFFFFRIGCFVPIRVCTHSNSNEVYFRIGVQTAHIY